MSVSSQGVDCSGLGAYLFRHCVGLWVTRRLLDLVCEALID